MSIDRLKDIWNRRQIFDIIAGYNDIKIICNRARQVKGVYSIVLAGPPGSAKTLFLMEIVKYTPGALYFDGASGASGSRMLDEIEETRPPAVCIDEMDKMPRNYQNALLGLMQDGSVNVAFKKRSYRFRLPNVKVFAASNNIAKMSPPMYSRFNRYILPPYTYRQFEDISVNVLPNLHAEAARRIAYLVWTKMNSKDIRDVMKIGRLVKHEREIDWFVEKQIQYGGRT